jgi:hypothetical protein
MSLFTSAVWSRDRALLVSVWVAFVIWCMNGLFLDIRNAVTHPEATDLSAYVAAARVKRDQGQGIHDVDKLHAAGRLAGVTGEARPYLYPPPFAEALVGTAGVPFLTLRVAWTALTYLAVIALFALVIHIAQSRGASALTSALLAFGVFVSYSPIQREIFYGQATLFCVTLTAAALLLDLRGRAVVAGAAAGLATIIKIYPGVLFVGFALKGRWVSIAAGIVVMALIAAVSLASYGSADWFSFFSVHTAKGASAAVMYADPSRRFLGDPNYSLIHVLYLWTRAAGIAAPPNVLSKIAHGFLGLGCVAFLWCFRHRLRESGSLVLWCHAVLLFFLPSSVVFWNHIFVFYLPGIVLTGAALLAARDVPAGLWMVWIAGVALMGLVDYAPNIDFLNRPPLLIFKPLKFYGLAMHGFAFGWMLRKGLLSAPPRLVEARV